MSATHTNRLIHETSPYLLQHAHNPVDWYAWGPDAFTVAREQNKPIFLSVGYSTCYWCHVMERQSFENDAIAAEMNRVFINIKVDREERPDVDQLYMLAVQIMTRQGGWPMSVFLTPDLKPFYGGTYFPPTDAYGRPGFPTLLNALSDAYRNRRGEVETSADKLLEYLSRLSEPRGVKHPITIDQAFVNRLIDRSTSDYDAHFGGFGSAPKFPRQTLLELLLVHNRYFPDERRMKMLRHTLDALDRGGIHDHLGGAFHRYSTDAQWLVPHFEIMLYDNAMLAWVYVESFRQTGQASYARTARGIFDFVLREMTSPEGAFYTAFDAEVDAVEGLSYLWTEPEADALLNPINAEDAKLFKKIYGLDRGPNFADPHHGNGNPDKNILFLAEPLDEALDQRLAPLRAALYAARAKRKQPLLDTKILTSWNALMIRAMAYGGQVLQEPKYLSAAARAARFLLDRHCTPNDQLFRTSRDGAAKTNAFLEDYAFLIHALLALHEADHDDFWKNQATRFADVMRSKFADEQRGGFFFTDRSATDLLVRQKTASDSPLPSGAAIAAIALLELGHPEIAQQTLTVFAQQLDDNAESMSALLETAVRYLQSQPAFRVAPSEDDVRPLTPAQFAAGAVSVTGRWASPTELHLHLDVAPAYHINAHDTASGLVATAIAVEGPMSASVEYPAAMERTFPFADGPIRVYEGRVTVVVRFDNPVSDEESIRFALTYQACTESACLAPSTQHLEVRASGT